MMYEYRMLETYDTPIQEDEANFNALAAQGFQYVGTVGNRHTQAVFERQLGYSPSLDVLPPATPPFSPKIDVLPSRMRHLPDDFEGD